MKQMLMMVALWGAVIAPGLAQEPIYRCGNEYTNNKPAATAKGCKLLSGGNVTVVQGTSVPKSASPKPGTSANPSSAGSRIDSSEQKARDSDARLVLQSELKKAQARQEELLREYNKGEPEKRGDEARNYQKYLDRVAELKASLARNESDIAGIRRELERLPGGSASSSSGASSAR